MHQGTEQKPELILCWTFLWFILVWQIVFYGNQTPLSSLYIIHKSSLIYQSAIHTLTNAVSDKLCNLLKRRPLSFMMPSDKEVSLPKNSTIGWPVSTVARNCSTVMDQCGSGPQPGFPFRSGDYIIKTKSNTNYIIQCSVLF